MRFIIGFFFFGLLFYAIYFYSPETFQELVSWAGSVFNAIRDFFLNLKGKTAAPQPPPETPKAIFEFLRSVL